MVVDPGDAAVRARRWFLLALALVFAAWVAQSVSTADIWYREGVIGLFVGLGSYAATGLAVVALLVGGVQLAGAAARRRTAPHALGSSGWAGGPTARSAVGQEGGPPVPQSSTVAAARVGPWAVLASGLVLLAAHAAARVGTGGGLLVVRGEVVQAVWVNVLVPVGTGLALLGLGMVARLRGHPGDDPWLLSAPGVLGGIVVAALLGGAVLDLALFGATQTRVLPAQAGATCDVVVEQRSFLFTGRVDVLALPHGSVVATTVLPDGPVGLEETSPFQYAEGAPNRHRVAWSDDGAALSFDTWDDDRPWETVRVDCA